MQEVNVRVRVRVRVTIRMDEHGKAATSMLESLLPDNVGIPEGLYIDFHTDGSMLVLIFEAILEGDKRMSSLISTIDEVLEHINTMVRVMNIVDVG
ncbi:MAG: KEOPS complex subunit Pcc1 [Candidatus Nitrosocaldus sp.]